MNEYIKYIKEASHRFTYNLAHGVDESDKYLIWFVTLPAEYKKYAAEVYDIFADLNFNRIDVGQAEIKYNKITNEMSRRDE